MSNPARLQQEISWTSSLFVSMHRLWVPLGLGAWASMTTSEFQESQSRGSAPLPGTEVLLLQAMRLSAAAGWDKTKTLLPRALTQHHLSTQIAPAQ